MNSGRKNAGIDRQTVPRSNYGELARCNWRNPARRDGSRFLGNESRLGILWRITQIPDRGAPSWG